MKIALVIAILFFTGSSYSQENICRLTLTNGDETPEVFLQKLVNDSLAVLNSEKTLWIPVASIINIRQVKKSQLWRGAGNGFAQGMAFGGLLTTRIVWNEENEISNPWLCTF